MDENPTVAGHQPVEAPSPALEDALTGVPAVDAVLSEVAGLAGLPVADHVGVFERAHDQLRRALDADPEA